LPEEASLNPQIEFRHVLGELSVNRSDPCEVLRELISNSYDAQARNILYAPLKDRTGLVFLDDGSGLDTVNKVNGVTPWEAFFSIGKSTKKKGDGIGYKCQGTKLCFASSRILVASPTHAQPGTWSYKIIDNPRHKLDTTFDITPDTTTNIGSVIDHLFAGETADTADAIAHLKERLKALKTATGTLVVIDNLDTENFGKYFAVGSEVDESYVANYIRFYTRHGDVRNLSSEQGFSANHVKQVAAGVQAANFSIYANKKSHSLPFGYPYLAAPSGKPDPSIKPPAQVSRLRDGRFFSRGAKVFSVGPEKYSIVIAIDGNRRAHDEYKYLARKGKAMSGIRLSEQRGVFISVKGIKICRYQELMSTLGEYEVLSEGESASHYLLIVDGDFDLVTNRNALSKKAYDTLLNPGFVAEVKKFLDSQRANDSVFRELLSRLRRESSETLLNEQIEDLNAARKDLKTRERFRVKDSVGKQHLFLSPGPGDEYLVGVLYSQLSNFPLKTPGLEKYWRRVITFSTQGIDSLGLREEAATNPLAEGNICAIEYKYEFNNTGPFNHALAVVDYIIAWIVEVDPHKQVVDSFTCFGKIEKVQGNDFEWRISGIENNEGGTYQQTITVICLRTLIEQSFETEFKTPGVSVA